MNFSQFMLIVRMRRKIILTVMALTVFITLLINLLMPKTYKATATIVLNSSRADAVSGVASPAQASPEFVASEIATQVDIIKNERVALKVVDDLKLDESSSVKHDFYASTHGEGNIRSWLAGLLAKKLEVVPGRESSILEISFKGNNPQFAATVANAFANAYQQISIQLKTEPLRQASDYFDKELNILRVQLEAAQAKLAQYQQEKGIIINDQRLDIETARLNDLSTQLVMAQGQRIEAALRRQHGSNDSSDVMNNTLVQRLKEDWVNAESKLSQASQIYGVYHPQYLGAKAEAEKLRVSLNEHTKAMRNSLSNNERVYQQREAELNSALAAQKAKVLELNRTRDEKSAMLIREVEGAQHAYEAASQRFNQTRLEGQANQSEVSLLDRAFPPTERASPKIVDNVILSVILGAMLGLGAGLWIEVVNRPVRSLEDLTHVLEAPVLGVIDWNAPAVPRRARRFKLLKWVLPQLQRAIK